MAEIDDTIDQIASALRGAGIYYQILDGDILITDGRLSSLLYFCQEWRSEIEELG